MLKYFVDTTELLLMAGLLIGIMFGFVSRVYGAKKGTLPLLICSAAGLVGSVVMAYLKNATSKIDTSLWNLRIFAVSLCAMVLFFVFSGIGIKVKKLMPQLASVMLGVIAGGLLMQLLPDVFTYPYTILLTEKSALASAFLLKCCGILFGLLLVFLAGLAVGKIVLRLSVPQACWIMCLALLANGMRHGANSIRIMQTKRILITPDFPLYHQCFNIIKFTSNHAGTFTFLMMLVAAAAPVLLLIRSLHVKEPYSNPAEHRKIRKKWLVNRRWACFSLICAGFSVLTLTAFKSIVNRPVDLAPIEDCKIEDDVMHIPFEQVADGHMHRFAYTTESGTQIRVIIIKKPNSSAYGIGLDACDICGETGYYEKDGQVVCKLCDVVMNINTIGFKGG
ncbi:MAG TPA: hypothetical protein DCG49_13685, partial [Ruminococcus sp.]|nr:hypothetical protein [Ruminococcus sp.]